MQTSSRAGDHAAPPASIWPRTNRLFAAFMDQDRLGLLKYRNATWAGLAGPDRRILAELRAQARSMRDGTAVALHGPTDGDLRRHVAVVAGPPDTPYEGGLFFLRVEFSSDYPRVPPDVYFLTYVYHPNVDNQCAITLASLDAEYSPALTVSQLLLGVAMALGDPDEGTGEEEIAFRYMTDRAGFNTTARQATERYAMVLWPGEAALDKPTPMAIQAARSARALREDDRAL